MNISEKSIIGTVVAEDYRTAEIFEKAGIDFCCHGDRSIQTACQEQQIPTSELLARLTQVVEVNPGAGSAAIDYTSWPLDLLADFIEKKHHRYVKTQIPLIQFLLEKIVQVHGSRHPELAEIKTHFEMCAGELTAHMQKEEVMLFPFIRHLVDAQSSGHNEPVAAFGSVENPIRVMMQEHDSEGERFRKIKALSSAYTAPQDGCSTYRTAFANLLAFEQDLHLHIHLENNILFPRAIELEASLGS